MMQPTETIPAGISALHDIDVTSIHYHTGDMVPGGLFVAIEGYATDGHQYIQEAAAKGAVAAIVQKEVESDLTIIAVDNTRKALAALAADFYRTPSERLFVIGITGTNGKTTTALLIESILNHAGLKTGIIGTLNYRYDDQVFDNPVTTPESLDLQRILAEMEAAGITHVVMEVSSHAIDLFRIDHCHFDLGVFTNLTQDHLDFHGDMDSYWQCKKSFFTDHLHAADTSKKLLAVVNLDTPQGRELVDTVSYPAVTIGRSSKSMIRPNAVRMDLEGIQGRLQTPQSEFTFKSVLIGNHNLENILCAVGVATVLNLPIDAVQTGLASASAIPGRLERIANEAQRFVFVDYAHTPDALENVLHAMHDLNPDRIICVFGCGGNRDAAKRPQMGEIAGRLCDLVIVTSDNPRLEQPLDIIDQILVGIRPVSPREYRREEIGNGFDGKGFCTEPDRRAAIQAGIRTSRPGDVVLIAGKGHETYQIIGNRRLPFDDRVEAGRALAELRRQKTGRNA